MKSGRYAIEKFGGDTLLLDEGFQYWRLRGRRMDVALIACQQPFGNAPTNAAHGLAGDGFSKRRQGESG